MTLEAFSLEALSLSATLVGGIRLQDEAVCKCRLCFRVNCPFWASVSGPYVSSSAPPVCQVSGELAYRLIGLAAVCRMQLPAPSLEGQVTKQRPAWRLQLGLWRLNESWSTLNRINRRESLVSGRTDWAPICRSTIHYITDYSVHISEDSEASRPPLLPELVLRSERGRWAEPGPRWEHLFPSANIAAPLWRRPVRQSGPEHFFLTESPCGVLLLIILVLGLELDVRLR